MASTTTSSHVRRKLRVRNALRKKAAGRPRLSVFRSGKHMYAQIIDDLEGRTIAHASTLDKDIGKLKNSGTKEAAKKVGELIAKRAKSAKIDQVVFDRGGYLYHGRVQALADGAREGGLKF